MLCPRLSARCARQLAAWPVGELELGRMLFGWASSPASSLLSRGSGQTMVITVQWSLMCLGIWQAPCLCHINPIEVCVFVQLLRERAQDKGTPLHYMSFMSFLRVWICSGHVIVPITVAGLCWGFVVVIIVVCCFVDLYHMVPVTPLAMWMLSFPYSEAV